MKPANPEMIASCRLAAIALLALSAVPLGSLAGDVTLSVTANRDNIYLGESVILDVSVSGERNPSQPDLSQIKQCQVKFLGSEDRSYDSIVTINGRVQRESFRGRRFAYEVTPSAAGTFVIGPVKLRIGDKEFVANGPTVTVTNIERQDIVRVSVTASRDSLLVDEPFDITLKILVRTLPAPYAEADPLFPGDPPQLKVPYLSGAEIPGLSGPDIRKILGERLVRRSKQPGFGINDYTVQQDLFDFDSMFDSHDPFGRRQAVFTLDKLMVKEKDKSYVEYALTLRYTPKEEGNFVFGPVEFKGQAPVEVNERGEAKGMRIFAVGPAATVRVVPPPEENRPPSYAGAIGSNLVVSASLDAQTCNVGDPLKLTLSVSGNVLLNNVFAPKLTLQTNLTENFEVYDNTVETVKKENSKEFVYTLRPLRAGTLEVPSIEVSYYDTVGRVYKTVMTKPIPVRARQTQEVTASEIIGPAANRVDEGRERQEASDLVVAPLIMDPRGAEPAGLVGSKWLLFLVPTGPLLFVCVVSVRFAARRIREGAGLRRRRGAASRAAKILKMSERIGGQKLDKARGLIVHALRVYVADRCEAQEEAITPADAAELLARDKVNSELAARFCEVLERNFNAQYVTANKDMDLGADINAAYEIIGEMEKKHD